MHNKGGSTVVSDHHSPIKQKKPKKSREVSSRFLSPTSSATSSSTEYGGIPSAISTLSPLPQKSRSSIDSRKHKRLENSGFLLGLWPSSSNTVSPVTLNTKKTDTHNNSVLEKQKSCTEFSRFENGKQSRSAVFGSSIRYTGNFKFPGNKYTTLIDDQNDEDVFPGRFSVDENALRSLSDSDNLESESEYIDIVSGRTSIRTPGKKLAAASYMTPTVSSRKHGIEVSSKFMQDLSSRSRRWNVDSGLNSSDISHSPKIFTLKNAMRKGNSKWALSPEQASLHEGKRNGMEFPGLKPPTSPKGKGVGNILSRGIELLKGKKYSTSSQSRLGPDSSKSIHQLRLLHNRLVQWRYSNAKADLVNANVMKQAENKFICASNGTVKLRHSVITKKLQLQKEKLELKLNYILQSQMKTLESWRNVEREHSSAISATKDYLHYVICKIPLVDGAKVDPQSASRAVRHASDVTASINLSFTRFFPTVKKTVGVLVELAKVVTQEKLLLEECLDLYRIALAHETHERSLKSTIVQLKLNAHQLHYQRNICLVQKMLN